MSTIKSDTLSTLSGAYSVPTETLARASCKAWVNFNGTGTVAIRRAFNVSSITDNGVGDYTVNFTNAMVDANYGICWSEQPSPANVVDALAIKDGVAPTTSAVRVQSAAATTGTGRDALIGAVAIFS